LGSKPKSLRIIEIKRNQTPSSPTLLLFSDAYSKAHPLFFFLNVSQTLQPKQTTQQKGMNSIQGKKSGFTAACLIQILHPLQTILLLF
jgi:hypothetical protein